MAFSDVKLKHKVQLRTKVAEPNPADEEPKAPKSKAWIWVLVGVAALVVAGYFLFSQSNSVEQAPTAVESTATSADVNTPAEAKPEEPAEEAKVAEVDAPEATPAEVPAPEVPAASAETTETAVPPASASAKASDDAPYDLEAEAIKVIRGDYGVGRERKKRLGVRYQPIQNRVNELKREGFF